MFQGASYSYLGSIMRNLSSPFYFGCACYLYLGMNLWQGFFYLSRLSRPHVVLEVSQVCRRDGIIHVTLRPLN